LEICGILSAEYQTAPSNTANRAGVAETAIGCPEWTFEEIDFSRHAKLPIVRLERGWDDVRDLFRQEQFALTEYRNFMWRKPGWEREEYKVEYILCLCIVNKDFGRFNLTRKIFV
jgi:hypothetical protein